MFRVSKQTDYGIAILAHLAKCEAESADDAPHNARQIAADLSLPLPMVSKVLKTLARARLLASQRGSKGGFRLSRSPEALTVAEMVSALEGPLALTECLVAPSLCAHESSCAVQQPWHVINVAVKNTLETMTLADLIEPGFRAPASVLPLATATPTPSQPRDQETRP